MKQSISSVKHRKRDLRESLLFIEFRDAKSAQYKVFWNKPQQKRVLVLQFPNRKNSDALKQATSSKPLELRIKPGSGLVEVDIPIQIDKCYNRYKGVQFGKALKTSKTLQNNGEYGIAGGFGAQPAPRTGREAAPRTAAGEDTEDYILDNFEEALRQEMALSKITLGGRIRPFKEGDPMYAIGAFHESR
jgi:DNA-directed RNA polymerase-3 subunit RPC5